MTYEYQDKQGKEITRDEWCELLGDYEYRKIKTDEIDDLLISTIWLGMKHAGYTYFETMIFRIVPFKPRKCLGLFRYPTIGEAEVGHDFLLSKLKRGDDPEKVEI